MHPAPSLVHPRRPSHATRAACVALAALAMAYLHDRQWNGYDDGMYVHVADRVARGEVLNRDVQDMHFGYINFANAFALKAFGDDAVSLRYPLVVMGVANAALAFALLAGAGTAAATVASLSMTALSYARFVNPSAHWYVLFLVMLLLAALAWLPRHGAARYASAGLLVGLVVLFRQLSGAFVAAGVLAYLLFELPQRGRRSETLLGRAVVAVLGLGLAAYLLKKTDAVAFVMYGLWPLAILLYGVAYLAATNRDVFAMLLRFTFGAASAAVPLVAYHLYHGSVGTWLEDTVVAAFSITRLDFIDDLKYWATMVGGARAVVRPASPAKALIGLFWMIAPALPTVLGAAVVWRLWRSRARQHGAGTADTAEGGATPALAVVPIVAVFYFLVALHYQKWMYFFFGFPLTALGLLALTPAAANTYRRGVLTGLGALSAIAFFVIGALVPGLSVARPVQLLEDHGVPRCGIRLDAETADVYQRIGDIVEREVASDESIFALPVHPELYYIANRRNPTRFYNTALGLRSAEDVRLLLQRFEQAPPKLVFFNPTNHYVTAEARQVMDWVRGRYDPLGFIGAFDVYRHRSGGPGAAVGGPASTVPHNREQHER